MALLVTATQWHPLIWHGMDMAGLSNKGHSLLLEALRETTQG